MRVALKAVPRRAAWELVLVRAPGSSLTEVTHRPNPSILHIPRPSTNKATIHGRNLLTIRFRRRFPSVESTYFRAVKKRGESATRRTAPSRGSPPVQARQRRRSRGGVQQREAVLSRDVPRSGERKESYASWETKRESKREREKELKKGRKGEGERREKEQEREGTFLVAQWNTGAAGRDRRRRQHGKSGNRGKQPLTFEIRRAIIVADQTSS